MIIKERKRNDKQTLNHEEIIVYGIDQRKRVEFIRNMI